MSVDMSPLRAPKAKHCRVGKPTTKYGLVTTRVVTLVGAAICLFGVIDAPLAERNRFISIGTGGPVGNYIVVGQALCDLVNGDAKEQRRRGVDITLKCFAPPSGGSSFNIRQMAIGAFTFALAQSDTQFEAYHGSNPHEVKPLPELRSVFAVYEEPVQVVVAKATRIESFRDLKGKRVNVGNPGSGARDTINALMAAHGMVLNDFAGTTQLTSTEFGPALCEGRIDAFATVTGFPAGSVAVATDRCGARILDLNTEVERNLTAEIPYFEPATIPKGTYRSTVEDVTTFGVVATLVTHERVGEDVVYDVVRSVMENLEELRARHPVLSDLDPEEMIGHGLTAPLHPGAIRYYRERGWM